MIIPFDVAGRTVTFHWSHWSGRTELLDGRHSIQLQSPVSVQTHVRRPVRIWGHVIDGHLVQIRKETPAVLPAFRRCRFQVAVDGRVVAERVGR